MPLTSLQQKIVRISKRVFDLGLTSHSNKLMGEIILSYANTLPTSKIKTRLEEVAAYIALHDELCYEEIIDYFNTKYYPDPDLMKALLAAFAKYPLVIRMIVKFLKDKYPDIKEGW